VADEVFKRKLAAILSADVEGYSRLMDNDEETTARTLTSYRTAIADLVQQYRDRVVDNPEDNILAEYTSVVDAVNCAVEIRRELAVRYLLQGSVQRFEDRVRITAQLIDAINGHHLGAESYDRTLEDIFGLQDEIAMKIMAELQMKLTGSDWNRISPIKTTSLKAYETFPKGPGHYLRGTKADTLEARRLSQKAIVLDPEYGAVYLLLGWTHLDDIWSGRTKDLAKSLQTTEELARKAIDLSGQDTTTHRLLSCVFMVRGQDEKTIAEAQKAVELKPKFKKRILEAYRRAGIPEHSSQKALD
jgi:tetratricopeptide (TPR) repeat protein